MAAQGRADAHLGHGAARARSLTVPKTVLLVRAELAPEEIEEHATEPLRTMVDCARRLPFDEALAVADSALRCGDVDGVELARESARARGPGARQVRRVGAAASPLAANLFESVLRAIALDAGLDVEPQAEVETAQWTCHPDLVDRERRLVLEADSWTYHAEDRGAWDRDLERYTALSADGWRVLRFSWLQVMKQGAHVASVLGEVAGHQVGG